MTETTGSSGMQKSYQKGGKQKSRQHRHLTDEEKAERTSRLPEQGPDPAILQGNLELLREIAWRCELPDPAGQGILDVDLRNIGRWLRSWPHADPIDDLEPEDVTQHEDERAVLDKALATLFLAPGAQPTHQVARLVADRHEHRIAVKRPKGEQWHEVRWTQRPLERFEDAVALCKPAGGLVDLKELPNGLWRCHFLPRVSAQNDLAALHHTRNADHWTPALACCTVLLPR